METPFKSRTGHGSFRYTGKLLSCSELGRTVCSKFPQAPLTFVCVVAVDGSTTLTSFVLPAHVTVPPSFWYTYPHF